MALFFCLNALFGGGKNVKGKRWNASLRRSETDAGHGQSSVLQPHFPLVVCSKATSAAKWQTIPLTNYILSVAFHHL